jgi:membrane protein DedA with SNARE-associated domain
VIFVGAAGELVGAYIAWIIGRYAGRGFVDRFGRFILLSHHDLDRAEAWYDRHPRWGVFGSRLLPVIRNFAALPAGVAEVPLVRFGILTALGSLIWDAAMALIGYGLGSKWRSVMRGFSDAGYVLGAVVVVAVVVVIAHRWRSYKAATSNGADSLAASTGRPTPRHRRSPASPPAGPPTRPSARRAGDSAVRIVRGDDRKPPEG